MNKPGDVGKINVLKGKPRVEEAKALLQKIHILCKPIQKKYGWYLPELCEFFPKNPNLLGMNVNRGQKILIRLRPAHDEHSFIDLESSLIGTMLHELTHNVHGPHDKNFYALLDKLQDEYDDLRRGGYTGEGFHSDGKRLGVSHNLPEHQARLKALEEAERRHKLGQLMGPTGGRTLGGTKRAVGKSPRELMAEAAERRRKDAMSCGHGEAVDDETVSDEVADAKKDEEVLVIDGDADDMDDEEDPLADLPPPLASTSNGTKAVKQEADSDSDIEIISETKGFASSSTKNLSSRKFPTTVLGKRPLPSTSASKPVSRPVARAKQDAPAAAPRPAHWECPACTFLNDNRHALACEVCNQPRGGNQDWDPADFIINENAGLTAEARVNRRNLQTADGWICHNCATVTENDYWLCRLCGVMKLSS